jgi:hypothetical protein
MRGTFTGKCGPMFQSRDCVLRHDKKCGVQDARLIRRSIYRAEITPDVRTIGITGIWPVVVL